MNDFVDKPNYLNLEYFFFKLTDWIGHFWYYITHDPFLSVMKFILSLIIVLLIIAIIYVHIQTREARETRMRKRENIIVKDPSVAPKNERWEAVKKHIASDNQADWKLAIIEADLILDDIVSKIRPDGESIGDRLKKINQSEFNTIQDAWEAHKVRNRIAHEGSSFTISRPEAQRVVGLYENVFREFKYI